MDRRLVHIVDDEAAVRRSIAFMLKTSGFAVELWESGALFLKEIRYIPMGCILLDVRMPELDGLAVQQALLDRGVEMPVIMMTGHGDAAATLRAMRLGAIDFVDKPFEKAVIVAAIGSAFDWHQGKADRDAQLAKAAAAVDDLVSLEKDILVRLAQGMNISAIGADLGLPSQTVELARASLMQKLGVRRYSELLRIAFAAKIGV